jgi:hypothetical protein
MSKISDKNININNNNNSLKLINKYNISIKKLFVFSFNY